MKRLIAHFGNRSWLVRHVTDEELEIILAKLEKCLNVFVTSDDEKHITNISHADRIDIVDVEQHIDVRV